MRSCDSCGGVDKSLRRHYQQCKHQDVLRVGMLTGQGMSRDGREYENTVEMHDKWT